MSNQKFYLHHPEFNLPYFVDVTAEHIRDGISADCKQCPIALALRDAGFTNVDVGNAYTLASGLVFNHHANVGIFIESFDEHVLVEPGTLEIHYDELMMKFLD